MGSRATEADTRPRTSSRPRRPRSTRDTGGSSSCPSGAPAGRARRGAEDPGTLAGGRDPEPAPGAGGRSPHSPPGGGSGSARSLLHDVTETGGRSRAAGEPPRPARALRGLGSGRGSGLGRETAQTEQRRLRAASGGAHRLPAREPGSGRPASSRTSGSAGEPAQLGRRASS